MSLLNEKLGDYEVLYIILGMVVQQANTITRPKTAVPAFQACLFLPTLVVPQIYTVQYKSNTKQVRKCLRRFRKGTFLDPGEGILRRDKEFSDEWEMCRIEEIKWKA